MALVDPNIGRVIKKYTDYVPKKPLHRDKAFYELMEGLVPQDNMMVRAFYYALIDRGNCI